jgi:histidyl-tRNA synthetase
MTSFTAPKGTYDILPPQSAAVLAVREALAGPLRLSGYGYIETPIFEDTALFERGVGASTDVVTKEMYTFDDKAGRSLTLRPEGTAGVVRAFVEHRMHAATLPAKLYYTGPNFRYERPQAGRYRHFTQVGLEAIGVDDPLLDAEVVWLAVAALYAAGLRDFRLQLNSLGDKESRVAHRAALVDFLSTLDLDEETRRRAEINPLRVLDDKRPELQQALAHAPTSVAHLTDAARAHYDQVRQGLTDLAVTWQEAPRLVRGLDYYTKTTFELVHDGLGAQSAVGGGGRYDGLSAELGGPELGGVGWAIGVDRVMLALRAEEPQALDAAVARSAIEAFLVPIGPRARSLCLALACELRAAGVRTDMAWGSRGLKGAMKAADRSGATVALVVGERDLEAGTAQLKDLRTGRQQEVPLPAAVAEVRAALGGLPPAPHTPPRGPGAPAVVADPGAAPASGGLLPLTPIQR